MSRSSARPALARVIWTRPTGIGVCGCWRMPRRRAATSHGSAAVADAVSLAPEVKIRVDAASLALDNDPAAIVYKVRWQPPSAGREEAEQRRTKRVGSAPRPA